MERSGIRTVDGKAEAVADHRADQGTFDVANGKRHAEPAPGTGRSYQSRQEEGGKRASLTAAAVAAVVAPVFCTATWHRSPTLTILSAGALLWSLPIHPRWWPRRAGDEADAEPNPARRSAADLALVTGCWLLATWALWQHRVLPLAICAVAGALTLFDIAARPDAPPPLCIPERTRRRPMLDAGPELQA